MLIADLITKDIPAIKDSDTVEQALHWMEEFKVTHLPVLHNKKLAGLVSEAELLDVANAKSKITANHFNYIKPQIHQTQHAFDALRLMSGLHLTLIPVLDEKENYLGNITQKSVLDRLAGLSAVMEQGGIIELELNKNDYSLTQIAGIVESNDAKILSSYVTSLPDSTKIQVTLKINRDDLTRILQTFYRYNYEVKASYHQAGYEDDLKTRFNEFIKYLDI
ncbi:MAG TPA: CBS domain-containing protein [Bacteroidia bacterium]|jgi:acetoin utilization protein AcuB|nr:CBS domain-containing protein [Bacteroidia bacterium]